jgi:hypothetical protein
VAAEGCSTESVTCDLSVWCQLREKRASIFKGAIRVVKTPLTTRKPPLTIRKPNTRPLYTLAPPSVSPTRALYL